MDDQDRLPDELISAYLDGEVTAEERALVEQRLTESEEDRRTIEELQALRSGLQTLPRHELGRDLSDRILGRAQRAMLATPAQAAARQQEDPRSATDRPAPASRRRGNWWALAWAGVTVAAILLIVLLGPGFERDRRVAKKPKTPAGGTDVVHESQKDRGNRRDDNTARDKVEPARREPPSDAVVRWDAADDRSGAVDQTQRAEEYSVRAEGNTTTPSLRQIPRLALAKPSQSESLQTLAEKLSAATMPDERLWVVSLNVSSQAFRSRSFDKSLARRRIHFHGDPEEGTLLQRSAAGRAGDGTIAKVHPGHNKATLEKTRQSAGLREKAVAGDVELVYVEAPADQIHAMLADLAARPTEFQLDSVRTSVNQNRDDRFENTPAAVPAADPLTDEPAAEVPEPKPLADDFADATADQPGMGEAVEGEPAEEEPPEEPSEDDVPAITGPAEAPKAESMSAAPAREHAVSGARMADDKPAASSKSPRVLETHRAARPQADSEDGRRARDRTEFKREGGEIRNNNRAKGKDGAARDEVSAESLESSRRGTAHRWGQETPGSIDLYRRKAAPVRSGFGPSPPEKGGGFGGGDAVPPSQVRAVPPPETAAPKKTDTAPGDRPKPTRPPQQMVRVLFVLCEVAPAANIAADVPPEPPSAAAAGTIPTEGLDSPVDASEAEADIAPPTPGED